MLIQYESPRNGLPIFDILKGLIDEKKRIKNEIESKFSKIQELEARINYFKESIDILEMKMFK